MRTPGQRDANTKNMEVSDHANACIDRRRMVHESPYSERCLCAELSLFARLVVDSNLVGVVPVALSVVDGVCVVVVKETLRLQDRRSVGIIGVTR